MPLQTYPGQCHCGAVRFEADLDLDLPTYRCNCSICRRTRFWPAVAGASGLRLLAGAEQLTEYRFGGKKNEHHFCKVCGVRPFGIGNDTPMGKMYGVNLGCLQGVPEQTLAGLKVVYADGLHDAWGQAPEYFSHL